MANEKRLIDANALMDKFRGYTAHLYDRKKCVSEENCNTCDCECLWRRIVKYSPTVDAVEVVHGRWVHDGQRIHNGVDWWHCSECNIPATGVEIKYNFCPNCGAKMDGDGNA